MGLLNRFTGLFRRHRLERELGEELQLHIELKTQENIAAGMPPEEARYAALRAFGGVEQKKEQCRDADRLRWLEDVIQDLRYGLRQLRRNPGFTAVAVLTLALGIGANTAIFTLINAVMLRSLPVADPGQLYRLGDNNNCCEMTGITQNGGSYVLYSYPLYNALRSHTPEFSELAAFTPFLLQLAVRGTGAAGHAKPYNGELVSGNYFKMFGIRALAGRALAADDDNPGASPVAVMSYHTWQQDYGLDAAVIGSTFMINGQPFTVIGVAPSGFYGDTLRSDPPDFWFPLGTEPSLNREGSRLSRPGLAWLYVIGRLKPGPNVENVQSHLTVELQQWLWQTGYASASPQERTDTTLVNTVRQEIAQQHIALTPARDGVNEMQTDYAAGLRLLMIVAGLVLLIACANIANLLLARGAARRGNIAVRAALGASRNRLIRQVVTESVLLSVLGGLVGLYVAFMGCRIVLLLAFRGAHYVPITAVPSWPVLAFAFLLSLATGIMFGAVPARTASHANPAEALSGAGRSTNDRSGLPRRSLVIVQVALSLVLLISAGLLTQSLRNLENQKFGFITQGRLIAHVKPPQIGYIPMMLYGFYQRVEEHLTQIPGVLSASLSDYSPMEGANWNQDVYIEGRRPGDSHQDLNSSLDRVSPHYFETIGTRLLRGRVINDGDTPTSRRVAVVNQTFVRKFFPNQDPIGHHFGLDGVSHSADYEIVGVVEDAKYQDARASAYPTAFLPLLQIPAQGAGYDIELHVAGKPESLGSTVRRTLAAISPNLTVLSMTSFDEQVALNFNQDRLIARLTELFGLLALLVACVGLYGVTAYAVARRTNEIGVRMALGAGRQSILALILRGALTQIIVGLAIGVPLALVLVRLFSSFLYGVKPTDPLTCVAVSLILLAVALVACYIPARRATKVDPMVALRDE
ncbi:MAG TPA: ABC transporter permease [Terriglobales bacterium]|nr:ABC transporter permease [Terriglobales bacterium]